MTHQELVEDWLNEFAKRETCSAKDLQSYAIGIYNYPDLINAIIITLEDVKSHEKFLSRICNQLFSYYRSKEERLRLFTLTFIPSLIGINLTNFKVSDKRYKSVDALLLGIYNLEVINEEGLPVSRSFRIPSIHKPSIYHEPSATEVALKFETPPDGIAFGPYQEYNVINAGNRMPIMTVLLKIYCDHLSSLNKYSYSALCRMTTNILRHGNALQSKSSLYNSHISAINHGGNHGGTSLGNYSELLSNITPVVNVSSDFLTILCSCVFFAIYNGIEENGLQALDAIHNKALCLLFSDVLLMTNAIKNYLRLNPYSNLRDDQININMALSPTSSLSSMNITKTAITNASFKTKKLPEDIPIVTSSPQLGSISEEDEKGKQV